MRLVAWAHKPQQGCNVAGCVCICRLHRSVSSQEQWAKSAKHPPSFYAVFMQYAFVCLCRLTYNYAHTYACITIHIAA